MASITIQEAQAKLTDLIHRLAPGEELVITENDSPVARLQSLSGTGPMPRRLGTLRGTVLHVAPDFDEPLEDFEEYMK